MLTGSQYGNDKAWQDVKNVIGDERKIEKGLCGRSLNFSVCVCVCAGGVASGGKRVTECIGPRGRGARDRRLAFGNTGRFHSKSGPIAETKKTSPILGAVFKLQRIQNRIKQIMRWRTCAALLPRLIRDKQQLSHLNRSIDLQVRCDKEFVYSCVTFKVL